MNANVTKTNGVKLFALVAVLAMVFAGAVVMMDDSVDAANDTTYLSGQVTATQNYGDGTNVVVNGDLTIPAGMAMIISGTGKLTINDGATLTIKAGGQLIIQQTTVGGETHTPTVNINGNITAEGTESADFSTKYPDITYIGAIVNNAPAYDSSAKNGVQLAGTITLQRGAELITSDNIDGVATVEEATSITAGIAVQSGATIDVTSRSSGISVIENQTIELASGATFSLKGHVKNVNVNAVGTGTYYTTSAATISAGQNYDADNYSELVFTVTTQNTPALTDEADANSRITLKQFILNVDGTVDGNDTLTAVEGESINGKSTQKYYDVEHGEAKTAGSTDYRRNAISPMSSITGTLTVEAGSTLSVDESAYVLISGTVTIKSTTANSTTTYANVDLNGTLDVTGKITADAGENNLTLAGTIIVDGGSVALTGDDAYIGGLATSVTSAKLYGTLYVVENEKDSTAYICDFDVAIANATQAKVETVYVFAYGSQNRTTADGAAYNGAFVIDTTITIPADMNLYIWNSIVVGETGTLVLEDGAIVTLKEKGSRDNAGTIFVDGKVVDYSGGDAMYDYEGTQNYDKGKFLYQVKKTAETETDTIVTYTTLKIALGEASAGEQIQLNGAVKIDEDMEIPADVTVITDSTVTGTVLTVESATLTVNGILEIAGDEKKVALTKDGDAEAGSIVVNNYIKNADDQTFTDGTSVKAIPGAYFAGQIGEDDSGTNYVSSIAVGKISMGDVTFTQGDSKTTVNINGEVSAGTVTLAGTDMEFVMKAGSSFTGSVSSAVTAGTATVDFSKSSGTTVVIAYTDDGETVTTVMEIKGDLKGNATVSAGAVDITESLTVGKYVAASGTGTSKVAEDKAVMTVASGATLNINGGTLVIDAGATGDKAFSGLVVDGTITYTSGTVTNNGTIDIAGTFNVSKNVTVAGIINVTGAVSVADDAKLTTAKMFVGDSEGASGTITGAIDTQNFIVAYPAANVSGAAINVVAGESTASTTQYYINDELYMTSYAVSGTHFGDVVTGNVKLVGFEPVANTAWYPTSEMVEGEAIDPETQTLDDLSAAYAKAEASTATIQISVGNGMSVYIDDVRYNNGDVLPFDVGTHTVSVQVNPGYTGTTSILFNGQTITGSSFTITPDMAGEKIVLSVTGEIAVDTGSTGGDDGMGLTEILLIILVILIVVMAIMVALRLMRS